MKTLVIVCTALVVASYHCKVKAGRLSDVQSPRNRSEDVVDTVYLKDRLRLLETRLDELETRYDNIVAKGEIAHYVSKGRLLVLLLKCRRGLSRKTVPNAEPSQELWTMGTNCYYDKVLLYQAYRGCSPRTPKDDPDKLPSNLLRARRANEGFVGFTAYIDHLIEHLGIDQPIVFDKVLLNEGKAYNPITGHFTCPVEGFYAFSYYIYVDNLQDTGARQLVAKLSVDGVNELDGIADTYHTHHEAQGGNFAVLHLRVGQSVYIQNYRWPDKNVDGSSRNRMSSFSGFLIS